MHTLRTAIFAGLATLVALGGVTVVGAFGSAAGASNGVISKSTVQKQAARILANETGQKQPKVTCRSGLKAKIGASIHCTVVPHGSKVKYPATVTVQSIHGSTATFYVQVGQAPGQANKAKFCVDETILATATSSASTPAAFLQALEANQQTILDFQNRAPSSIITDAGTLVQAARQAVSSQTVTVFGSPSVIKAQADVAAFCGQKVSG
jgi:hypothetical protein